MSQGQPSGTGPRQLALDLLQGVWEEHMLLAEMEQHPHFVKAPPEIRARAGRLARTTLRLAGRADAAMKPFLKRSPRPGIVALLRLAVVEMLAEGEAAHGVVNAAVTIAKREQPNAAPMVNAVLRRVAETGQESWDKGQPQRLPNWLRGRLGGTYGNARVARMEAAFEATPPIDLTPKGDASLLPEGDALTTGSLRLTRAGQVSALPGYETGDWWVQDAAAALPARILAPQTGERVLDLCAAPGGKTLQLAAAGAEVTALDVSETRLERLKENLTRTGLSAEIVVADALDWQPDAPFDAILLDAPCSATGTIRRHPDLPFAKDAASIKTLFALQEQLFDRAVEMLAPGGRLVFCTCSLLPEEGEKQLERALEKHPELRLDEEAVANLSSAEPNWTAGPGALRTTPEMWPERGGLDGFFIAALRKA
ncbi:RsmB/NOP family class I SAM-dependent RNA methyltransferase [Tropicimonas sp. TH_r6]|uniref:RsmB/NOP family class I SAM-dependent RNA methyltransferase n=1 Tax=Tropicimonas sp. TH_r6 TaxID=3082085 RepID=UPI002952AE64|nr:RsmB/NOP family class I SAM-dependent RNA methyltransferase [Tropicimonas sp. TH_r6]MDV7141216.1 RsmB/NOP family class I SAM-dependent RNA methyltransferase [Tropicimonas sp. TH_r6]